MKKRNSLVIGLSVVTTGLLLAGCDNNGVGAPKEVQVRPPAENKAESPSASLRNSLGSSTNPGPGGGAPGKKKEE